MSDSVDLSFANRILLVDSASVSQDLIHCYGDRRLQANLAVQRPVSRPEKGCLEVCRGCLHSGIHSQHVGSCWFVVRKSYIRRVSVRQGLIQRYGDRCRQANLEVQRSVSRPWAASRSGGDACTLGMSGIVLICRLQVVYSSSERPSESHRLLR